MSSDPALIKKLKTIMAKARRSMSLAKKHHTEGLGDEAASRAYYAVFHAVQAVLLTKRKAWRSPSIQESKRDLIENSSIPAYFPKSSTR